MTIWPHHLAAIFDNEYTTSDDRIAIYLDGRLKNSLVGFDIDNLPNSTSGLYIGQYGGSNLYCGWIEELRFSDIVRYSGNTYTVLSEPFTPDTNTRALWHFDEEAGSTSYSDSASYGNTLTGLNGDSYK